MAKEQVASLRQEIAALEAKLAGEAPKKQISAAEQTRRKLLAELKTLETKLSCMGMPMDDDMALTMDEPMGMMYMDDDMDEDDDVELDVYEDDDFTEMGMSCASINDPDGVEEQISDDYLSEMAKLTDKESLTTDEDIDEVVDFDDAGVGVTSSEQRVALLERASARLDRVASYCEQNGRVKLAFRIDQIADAIDKRIEQEKA